MIGAEIIIKNSNAFEHDAVMNSALMYNKVEKCLFLFNNRDIKCD